MKNNWQIKKLGEILELCDSGTWGKESPDGMPLLRSSNMQDGQLILNDLKLIDVPVNVKEKYTLHEGDILMTKSSGSEAHIGKSLYINSEIDGLYGFSNFTQRLRSNKKLVEPFFLYFLISSPSTRKKLLDSSRTTSGLRNLSIPILKTFEIPVPPISTQKLIVKKLDAIRKLLELNNKKIEKTEKLFKTSLSNNFEWKNQWKKVKLADICDVRDGTHNSPTYQPSGIPFVTSKNLKDDSIDFTNINYISEKDHKQIIKRSFVEKGDILFGMIGTIGNPVIVDIERSFSIKNVGLIKFPNKKIVNNLFIKYFLQSPLLESEVKRLSRGGTQKFVSLTNLRNLNTPLPPFTDQEKIASELNDIRFLISILRQKKVKLSELFESTLNKEMKGDLVN